MGVTAADLRFHVSRPVQWFDRDERIVPQGTTLLTGRPKSGKSLLCEQVAVEMAESRSVAYFAFEYGTSLMKDRFKRHVQADIDYRGLRLFSRDDVPGRERPLSYVQRVLHDARASGRGYDVAFIDVLNKVKPRTDGSYDREYDAVAPITELAPNQVKALVVVHHTRKRDPKTSTGDLGSVDEALGSTALAGAFDTVVGLTRKKNVLTLVHESRLYESRRCGLGLEEGRLVPLSFSDMVVTGLENSAPLQSKIYERLCAKPHLQSELAKSLSVSVPSVSRAVHALAEAGLIEDPIRGQCLVRRQIDEQ
jgi:DNA-binding transcriptional ArsR family regulator